MSVNPDAQELPDAPPNGAPQAPMPDMDTSLTFDPLALTERVKALEEENFLLRMLVDTHPDIMFVKDAQGLFRFANQTLINFYGTTLEDIVGREDSHYTGNTEQGHFFRRSVQQVLNKYEREVIFEDATDGETGEVNHFRSIKQPFHSPQGTGMVAVLAHNITTQVREHERKNRQIDHIYDTSLEGFWDWSISDSQVTHNRRWSQILEIPESELCNSLDEFAAMLHPDDTPEVMAAIEDCLAGKTPYYHRHRMLNREGKVLWVIDKGDVIERDRDGTPLRMIGSITDITRVVESEALLHQHNRFDSLTKLANRCSLIDVLQQTIITTAIRGDHAALVFIDLDHFKKINDLLGHAAGDHLLIEVAHRLSSQVRSTDMVARFGGDEFVILLQPLSAHESDARREFEDVMRKLQYALDQPYSLTGPSGQPLEHHSSASMGSIIFHGRGLCAEELIRRADIAMYCAKDAGRNQRVSFDPSMRVELERAVQLEHDLRSAIELGQMWIELQPQFDQYQQLLGAECLLRWRHPTYGMISPFEFIPLAEKSLLIVTLGDWVLEEACTLLTAWESIPALANIHLSINVSARQIDNPSYVDEMVVTLARHGIAPQRLQLELTESVFVCDMPTTVGRMHQLNALGLSLSLDDFGTGFSSLTYIKQLPFSELKIDRSFINDLEHDVMDYRMVEFIVHLGHELGMRVVAEGVETRSQMDHLVTMGCDVIQGYLLAKPMPVTEFIKRHGVS